MSAKDWQLPELVCANIQSCLNVRLCSFTQMFPSCFQILLVARAVHPALDRSFKALVFPSLSLLDKFRCSSVPRHLHRGKCPKIPPKSSSVSTMVPLTLVRARSSFPGHNSCFVSLFLKDGMCTMLIVFDSRHKLRHVECKEYRPNRNHQLLAGKR